MIRPLDSSFIAFCCAVAALLLAPAWASALIAPGADDITTQPPQDDPGWASVGKRLGGPTVIYLGNGWVLTAHHVGAGVVEIGGMEYYNVASSLRRFTNRDGSPADLIAFRIEPGPKQPPMPELPILPIRTAPPMPGEEVVLIGTGRSAGEPLEIDTPGLGVRTGFAKAPDAKRWGTNRVEHWPITVEHQGNRNQVLITTFDAPGVAGATPYEAGAASGDSGGALFALRNPTDPSQGWALAGIMSSVTRKGARPPEITVYGDLTHSIDVSYYRDQIVALVRPACSNELDDDGDGRIDHPADDGCESTAGASEGPGNARPPSTEAVTFAGGASLLVSLGAFALWRRSRAAAAPESADQSFDSTS
jgi:hypothetical protein